MNEQKLPLPNPEDWVSIRGAAALTGLSLPAVIRRIKSGELNSYLPFGAWEAPSSRILWKPEVVEYAKALNLVKTR